MTNIRPDPDSNSVPLSFEQQLDQMSHRGRPQIMESRGQYFRKFGMLTHWSLGTDPASRRLSQLSAKTLGQLWKPPHLSQFHLQPPIATYLDLMLIKCWATVYDAGPALNQHCCNVYCCPLTTSHQTQDIDPMLVYEAGPQ